MPLRIKDWHKFQHFKDRKPPWVKLYRDLLDDLEWHDLDAKAAKLLVMLWLIASENEGALPDVRKLAFRLRLTESTLQDLLAKLSHWLVQDDDSAISPRYQDDTDDDIKSIPLARSRETEGETEKRQRQRPARKCPKEFEVTADMREWAAKECPGVDLYRETAKMRDHTFKTPREDWSAVWRNWIREAFDRLGVRGVKPEPARVYETAEESKRRLEQSQQGTKTMPSHIREQIAGAIKKVA